MQIGVLMKIWLRVAALLMACASWSAFANPLETSSYNNIVYLADSSSTSVARYSLETQSFLTPITLAQTPTAIHADSTGIYVSYGTSIVKLGLDGTGESQYRLVSQSILDIESTNQWLVLAGYSYLQVVSKSNGTLLSSSNLLYTSSDINLSTDNQVFTTSNGISPADVYRIPLNAQAQIGLTVESPYHGSYSIGTNATPFPTQNRVVDSSGNVYNTIDLTHAGSLGGFYTSIGFWQGLPVVLRDDTLYSYNSALLETGSHAVNSGATDLIIYQDKVVLFGRNTPSNIQVQIVDVLDISPADPVAPIDPTNLQYTPDAWVLDSDGDTLYLLSKSHLNIFRWSIAQEAYLDSIPLANAPQQFAYDATNNRIYLSYNNGAINYIDLTTKTEKVFANLGSYASAMVVAGHYVVAKGDTGAWGSLTVYDSSGVQTDYRDWIEPTSALVWDSTTSGIYYISQFSPSDLKWIGLTDKGKLGAEKESPYHDSSGWADPVRVSETGRYIALATGRVVSDYDLLEINDVTQFYLKDLGWLNGNLFTLRSLDSNLYTRVDRFNADFIMDTDFAEEFLGEAVGIVAIPNRSQLLVIYKSNGIPVFSLLNAPSEDSDEDGVLDVQDFYPDDPTETSDFDRDGQGNTADVDDDNDNVNDLLDAFPFNKFETLDTDQDTVGNNTDTDDDNDGVADAADKFPLDANESKDLDNDGIGDNSDTDRDGDGVANSTDFAPDDKNEWADLDKDGIGNNADTDDDNDGVTDAQDYYPLDPAKSTLTAADFLPMAKSNQWVFDHTATPAVIGADKKIAGQTIRPLNFPGGGRFYLKAVNNQLQFYGIYFPAIASDYGTFSTDMSFNKGINLLTSASHSGGGDIVISPTYGKRNLTWTAQVTYFGSENVVVPAGQYATLHTRLSFNAMTTIDGVPFQIFYVADYWFAEGVGLVKIIENGFEMKLVKASVMADASVDGGSGGGGGSLGLDLFALFALLLLMRREKKSS
jgi:Thrombospondin type 3 repeat